MVYLKLLLTAIFWGGTFIAGRTIAGDVGPYSAAFLRFTVASIFLLVFVRRMEGRLPRLGRGQILPVVALGLTGVFAYNVFFFKGLHLIEAGRASLIIACNPIFISLLSALLFKEKLNAVRISGILVSVSGAIVVITRGRLSALLDGSLGSGELFIFGCVASWVAYSLLGKTVMNRLSALSAVCYSSMIGGALLFFPACAEGLFHDAWYYSLKDWISLFYLGFFGTVLGFVWYYQGIQRIGPMKSSLFINFVPVSAILLAYGLLDEPITWSLLMGAVLVGSGVYLTNVGAFAFPGRSARRQDASP
ncbi:MAG: DMT family transporter [Desulfobacterales bacterium]|nr:DMT family transporter [Desulfobacterales bacterium]